MLKSAEELVAQAHEAGASDIHLVCDRCAKVLSVPASVASDFVHRLESEYGFRTDISHVSVHGLCGTCKDHPLEVEPDDAP